MERRKTAEMNEVRTSFYDTVEQTNFEGHTFVGMSKEGAVFQNAEGLFAVVKVVAKSLDFDATAALEIERERLAVAEAREADRLAKKVEKAEKAKIRAEEKAKKAAEAEPAE